jgi:hypothetical protein
VAQGAAAALAAQGQAVVLVAPPATFVACAISTGGDIEAIFGPGRRLGLTVISVSALVVGLVLGLGATVRERLAQAKARGLQFALERETLQRQASDARLAALQSQIEPHPERYAQTHRSAIVNLARVTHVTRGLNETAELHLQGSAQVLPVSRSFLHRFRQM